MRVFLLSSSHPAPNEGRLQRHETRGGRRWRFARGAETHARRGSRPKLSGPGAPCRAPLGDMAAGPCVAPYGARIGQSPAAVARRKPERVTPPGGRRSKPQTPRAGRRGTGGVRGLKSTSASLGAARRRGPRGLPRPRRPARPLKSLGAWKAHRPGREKRPRGRWRLPACMSPPAPAASAPGGCDSGAPAG